MELRNRYLWDDSAVARLCLFLLGLIFFPPVRWLRLCCSTATMSKTLVEACFPHLTGGNALSPSNVNDAALNPGNRHQSLIQRILTRPGTG